MRIALVGFGRWGRNHARVLAAASRLAAVVDPDPVQRASCGQLYPGTKTFADLLHLPWSEIDGVIIASPIEHHVPQALTVLDQGKHCLVEKPLALDAADVKQLANRAEIVGCVLVTGHILDFHPGACELVRLCRSGRLGRLRYWHSGRARLVPPRNYVSVLEELVWHDLTVLLRIMGRLPDSVRVAGDLHEDGMLTLDFGDCYATLRGSQIQSLRESSLLVGGELGTVQLDDEQPPEQKLKYQRRGGGIEPVLLTSWEPLAAEIEHFVSAARGEVAPINGPRQVGEILRIIEMARELCLT